MFERYTEKARRTILFARCEASRYGSPCIETQHILLGLLREDRALMKGFLGETDFESEIRTGIERRIAAHERIPTSVEMPLTSECSQILNFAAEEADRLGHGSVGTEHLLLGMLLMEGSLAAEILQARGLKLAQIRQQLQKIAAAAIKPRWQGSALPKLEDFLSGLKRHGSQELLPFFAKNAHFVDASGKVWNREEIGKHFETLFILYAKKNASYLIEKTIQDTKDAVVAVVLWKNAILASMERVWMHRMSIILVPEGEQWAIAWLQVTPVKPT